MAAVCFTGHRQIEGVYYDPDKMSGHWYATWMATLKTVYELYKLGYTEFISGGALGFDQLAAHAVKYFKDNTNVPTELWMALPFQGFESKWPAKSKLQLAGIVGCADKMLYVNQPPYAPWKLHKRNEWMVDNSLLTLAMYVPGTTGGTLNCINYAKAQKRPLVYINPLTGQVKGEVFNTTTNNYQAPWV